MALAECGMTAQEMAVALGVARSTWSRWSNGHGGPPEDRYIRQLAEISGVDEEWLRSGRYPDGTDFTAGA